MLKKDERLKAASQAHSFSIAKNRLEDVLKPNVTNYNNNNNKMRIDETYPPVEIKGKAPIMDEKPVALGFNYRLLSEPREDKSVYGIRVIFEDQDAIEKLIEEHPDDVQGVFADPTITVFPRSYCGEKAIGTHRTVGTKLGLTALKRRRISGRNVRVAVVDTGIDGSKVPVSGGWGPPGSNNYVPGSSPPDHGTMVAFDVRISAPKARILDYALLQSNGQTWTAFLSDAIAAFSNLIDLVQREPGPLVVNNSWGMFDRSEDAPIGSAENYSANPDHPFSQITSALVAAGADVLFAAGNCGADCPDGRCGVADVGPGASIHGANSHPDVITVAAITVEHNRLGYSSQGPGGLYRRKPDIAAYSHFAGSKVYPADGGTSAASPVAAGVIAALRQKFPDSGAVTPAALKGIIQKTAIDVGRKGWDYNLGYGIINAKNALNELL